MYQIRFHRRGGQGVKTASRILGTACFRAGLEVQDAPRYGAERRGAPIFTYVRVDRAPIRERGIIRDPDLVVVADPTLVPIPAAGVLTGLDAHSILLINSRGAAADLEGAAEPRRPRHDLRRPAQALRAVGTPPRRHRLRRCRSGAPRLRRDRAPGTGHPR